MSEYSLERFKQNVVETVVEWDAGCKEGKKEFLEALGLEWPTRRIVINISFDYDGDVDNIHASDIEYSVEQNLEDEASNFDVEIHYD